MADMPARALVIYGDGLLNNVAPQHNHLHALAAAGCCGFLALQGHSSDLSNEEDRISNDFEELLDVHDKEGRTAKALSERFMGMKAALYTNSKAGHNIGSTAGFLTTVSLDREGALPSPTTFASAIVCELGLTDQTGNYDMLMLHIEKGQNYESVDWINTLVGELRELSKCGTKASKNLYIALVFGNRGNTTAADLTFSEEIKPSLRYLRPRQSYSMKDGKPVDSIRDTHSMLAVYRMDSVTRRDNCKMLTIEEFRKNCGNLTILANRFLHEIAFKLWKAPKYGA